MYHSRMIIVAGNAMMMSPGAPYMTCYYFLIKEQKENDWQVKCKKSHVNVYPFFKLHSNLISSNRWYKDVVSSLKVLPANESICIQYTINLSLFHSPCQICICMDAEIQTPSNCQGQENYRISAVVRNYQVNFLKFRSLRWTQFFWDITWARSCENVSYIICEQQRCRSACTTHILNCNRNAIFFLNGLVSWKRLKLKPKCPRCDDNAPELDLLKTLWMLVDFRLLY